MEKDRPHFFLSTGFPKLVTILPDATPPRVHRADQSTRSDSYQVPSSLPAPERRKSFGRASLPSFSARMAILSVSLSDTVYSASCPMIIPAHVITTEPSPVAPPRPFPKMTQPGFTSGNKSPSLFLFLLYETAAPTNMYPMSGPLFSLPQRPFGDPFL